MKPYEEQKVRRRELVQFYQRLDTVESQNRELADAVKALAAVSGYTVVKKDGVPRLVKTGALVDVALVNAGITSDDDTL